MKAKRLSKLTAHLLTFAMLMTFVPGMTFTAFAADAVKYIDCTWDENAFAVKSVTKSVTDYTTVTSKTTAWSDGWYVVSSNVTVSSRITVSGTVHLILADGAKLTANQGIEVTPGNTLCIYAQSTDKKTMGSIYTKATNDIAGIGGNKENSDCGTVIINGGIIDANGRIDAAGIGGGLNGKGGTVTINGGIVTATGSTQGAGIGGSGRGNGGTVTINGGVVTANGGGHAAGIGGGGHSGGDGGTVTINGGVVTAAGDKGGAGIGGGVYGDGGNVTIRGGLVAAYGGHYTYASGSNYIYPEDIGRGSDTTFNNENQKGQTSITGGVVIMGQSGGKLYSDSFTLTQDFTLPSGKTLTVESGKTFIIADGVTFTNSGTVNNNGTVINNGSIINNSKITNDGTITNNGEVVNNGTITNNGIINQNGKFQDEKEGVVGTGTINCNVHIYTAACDKSCNACKQERSDAADHSYENGICIYYGEYEAPEYSDNDNCYKIKNAGNLMWFAALVNGQLSDGTPKNQAANAALMNDIDMTGALGYTPIGTTGLYYNGEGSDKGYRGIFDGQEYAIKNLSVQGSDSKQLTYGVFGTLSGTVKNLGVESLVFTVGGADCRAGGIAGQVIQNGKISTSYVRNSTINAAGKVAGGIAGCNYGGTIESSYAFGNTVTASRAGGIVGDNRGDKSSSDRKGTISNSCTDASTIENSARQGNIIGGAAGVSEAGFAGGEAAYVLNGSMNGGSLWYQNIDNGQAKDAYPVLDNTHGAIYRGYVDCDAAEISYSNTKLTKSVQGHNGGEATCIAPAVCKDCGKVYEEIKPDNHVSTETYIKLIDEATHGTYHSCCNALVSSEAHTAEEATCQNVSYCDVCETAFGAKDASNHAGKLVYVNTGWGKHYQKWDCCGVMTTDYEDHTLSHTADEDTDTITAVCGKCEASGTVTMNIEGGTYKGFNYEASKTADGILNSWQAWAIPTFTYCCNDGCNDIGEHTATMTLGGTSVRKSFTITPKTLGIDAVVAFNKSYDGTGDITINGVRLGGVVVYSYGSTDYQFDDVLDSVAVDMSTLTYTLPDVIPGEYNSVALEGIRLIGEDAHNYTIDSSNSNAYLQGDYGTFTIYQAQVFIMLEDQILVGEEEIDQSKYTVEDLPEGFEISNVTLYEDEYDGKIHVNEEGITVTLNGTNVTEYFWFVTSSANLSRVCEGHTFNEDGFCSTGGCETYEAAVLNDNGTLDTEWDDYYEIYTPGQLYWFAERVNKYNFQNDVKLMNDIVVNEGAMSAESTDARSWTPIMNYYGDFDGNGKMVSGLYCVSEGDYVGLFGILGYYSVTDLHISNSYFEGNEYVGAIAGSSEATIERCFADDTVSVAGNSYVGGLVGYTYGGISNSYSHAAVSGENVVGGLVGYSSAAISNCYTTAENAVYNINSSYGGSLANVYYLGDTDDFDGTTAVTAEQLASGEIAYLLQEGVAPEDIYDEEWNYVETIIPEVWGQMIDIDEYPVLGGEKVYLYGDKYLNEITAFEIKSHGAQGSKATAEISIPAAGTYTVIFADYEDGKLINLDTVTKEFEVGLETVTSEKDITLGTDDKIMLWENMTILKPLCSVHVITE